MSRARIRLLLAAALVSLNLFVLAGPIHAQGDTVSGNLLMLQKIALSPTAVAVITLADRSPAGAGTSLASSALTAQPATTPSRSSSTRSIINTKHAYTIYASIIDGTTEYQSLQPVPVITGGPVDGLVVQVGTPAYQNPGQITGTIALPSGTTTSTTAVAYAAILDATTGRLVSRQVIPSPATFPAPFTVSYDQALVNPDDLYVAAAGVIDGTTWYQSKSTTPITPDAKFDLTVAKTGTIPGPGASGSPVASGTPGASASGTPGASETPAATKTPKPTPTEAPTATPTEAPTATPTASPTQAPTEAPSASPTVAPSATVPPSGSASPGESASPAPVTVTGSVSYKDPWTLTDQAVLTINVVQIDPNGPKVVPVGQTRMDNPGQQPIKFSVTLDPALLVTTNDAFLYATLIDGKEAWTSAQGIKVATNGNPTENVDVPLTFRPDLVEGNVTGAFLDLPNDISSEAWAAVALLNKADGTVLGFQSGPLYAGSGAFPFEVPFLIANVDPNADYVAIGTVFDGPRQFTSQAEPVITKGNPYQNVILHGVQTAGPSAAPSAAASASAQATAIPTAAAATATAHPAPTASPTSSSGSGGGLDPLLIAGVAALVIVGLIVVLVVARR